MNKLQRVVMRKSENFGCHPERSEGPAPNILIIILLIFNALNLFRPFATLRVTSKIFTFPLICTKGAGDLTKQLNSNS
jgi:hypothetical protein